MDTTIIFILSALAGLAVIVILAGVGRMVAGRPGQRVAVFSHASDGKTWSCGRSARSDEAGNVWED